MKGLIILFAGSACDYQFNNAFDGKSGFYKTLEWAKNVNPVQVAVFCCDKNIETAKTQVEQFKAGFSSDINFDFVSNENWTNEVLFEKMNIEAKKCSAEAVLFLMAASPFVNLSLTEKLIARHSEYKSEYTFADGYPYGVAPEILDSGLVNILDGLIKTKENLKDLPVSKNSIFDLIKTDINSFEIETEISETDWRLYRFDFSCNSKENLTAAVNLYECIKDKGLSDIQQIIKAASESEKVLKTIPAFFNIQIEKKCNSHCSYCPYSEKDCSVEHMNAADFSVLVKKINDFNPNAVVGISLWGESVLNPEFEKIVSEVLKYENLSVLIETSGFTPELLSDSSFEAKLESIHKLCSKTENGIKTLENGYPEIMWIVSVDSMSDSVYEKLHPGLKRDNALKTVSLLEKYFSGSVYPQFLRLNENEDELESFYRTFKESSYISHGKFLIQKYDNFAGLLADCKPADLSPVDRLPCWHLRRDMNILINGDVVKCRECLSAETIGNVFNESLEDIWNKNDLLKEHITKNYCKRCLNCDEYYTFNF